jgi:hypothetical protein
VLLQRYLYDKGRNLTTDGVLLTGAFMGSDIAVQNHGNDLLGAFGFERGCFSMTSAMKVVAKPGYSRPVFCVDQSTVPPGVGWYLARSIYGFSGFYKKAEDQTGNWRARQKESVAALVAARTAARTAARMAAEGGGGGGTTE